MHHEDDHHMHAPHARLSNLGLAVAALCVSLGGCMADTGDGGILVIKNVFAGEECKPTASETEPFFASGRLDLLLQPSGYLFIAQMKSRITALTGQEDQRTIITSGARVDIEFPGSSLFNAAELTQLRDQGLTRFKQLFSAAIKPNGGITDAGFDLIPSGLAQRVASKLDLTQPVQVQAVATFTVEGSMSGSNVESQAFSYPVTLGTFQTVNLAGTCPLPSNFGEVRKGYACNPAQDGIIDCCTEGGLLRCPAVVGTAAL